MSNDTILTIFGHTFTGLSATLILLLLLGMLVGAGYSLGHKQGISDGMRLGVVQQKIDDLSKKK